VLEVDIVVGRFDCDFVGSLAGCHLEHSDTPQIDLGKNSESGNLLGTTRVSQPGLFGSSPLLRIVNISGGVWSSRPEQNGQRARASGVSSSRRGSGASGRCARADEMITHRPLIGSFRSSGLNSAMVSSASLSW